MYANVRTIWFVLAVDFLKIYGEFDVVGVMDDVMGLVSVDFLNVESELEAEFTHVDLVF
jgi:hypothetical protein